MGDWKAYARERDQIYHYKVGVRQHHDGISPHRRTPGLIRLMELVDTLVNAVAHAQEHGEVIVLQIDNYAPLPLPGFEDLDAEMKKPNWEEGFSS